MSVIGFSSDNSKHLENVIKMLLENKSYLLLIIYIIYKITNLPVKTKETTIYVTIVTLNYY